MKILLYGSNYAPELTGVGKYTAEMACWLAARGHQVRVITAPPHYPEWEVRRGYSSWRWSRSVEAGVTVWRCPAWIPAAPRGLARLLHTASFAIGSFPILLGQLFWKPDIVWVVEPPLLCAPAAAMTARLVRAVSWLHVQDFEVDAAFELGLLKGARARAAALAFERWLFRRFSVVSTISGKMVDRLISKGVTESQIVLLPNWTDSDVFDGVTLESVSALRRKLDVPSGARVALYSGNMGRKQGLEILARVAKSPAVRELAETSLCFVFCGNGVGRPDLEDACGGLANVRFSDLLPAAEFPVLLQLADIHLLPQLAQASDLVMPSKLGGILASGRPVVASACPDTELALVASTGGVVVAPGDHDAMARAVAELASDEALRLRLGRAGSEYAANHLDRDHVLSSLEAHFQRLSQLRS